MAADYRLKWINFSLWLFILLGYGKLCSQEYVVPGEYYEGMEGLVGDDLRRALHDLIDNQNNLNYINDLPTLWRQTEADPNNPGQILLIYSGLPAAPDPSTGGWNREHTWPRSYGADSGAAFSDAHHLYPCNISVNEIRSNYIFDHVVFGQEVNMAPGSLVDVARRIFEPRDEDKGRIARAQLYMDLRYDETDPEGNLVLSDSPNSGAKRFARLSTLLGWHRTYPPDARERKRNHIIHNGFFYNNKLIWQGNRNPFVDFPELADALHTADDFISRGSWRVEHFSFTELLDISVSGDLSDPDNDGLLNLMEFSQNMDPRAQTVEGLPQIHDNEVDELRILKFSRLPRADLSNVSYSVESSEFPLTENSWVPMALTDSNTTIIPDNLVEQIEVSGPARGAFGRFLHYRLKVTRELNEGGLTNEIFDPVRFQNPDSTSIFLYSPQGAAGWRLSDWFGYLWDETYPWIYHSNHHWAFVDATKETSVFLFDSSIGWIWTAYGIYPALYSFSSGTWLYFVLGTNHPERWFIDYDSGEYLSEKSLTSEN